jgi:hypothetical protein
MKALFEGYKTIAARPDDALVDMKIREKESEN